MKTLDEINQLIDARLNLINKEIESITIEQTVNNGKISSTRFKLKNYLTDLETELLTLRIFINSGLDNKDLLKRNFFKGL